MILKGKSKMSKMLAPMARVTRVEGLGMATVKLDLAMPDLAPRFTEIFGNDVPKPRSVLASGASAGQIAWMAPDEILDISMTHQDLLDRQNLWYALDLKTKLTWANVSDARAVFEIAGRGAREVLAKLCPVDLHPDSFGPGEMRRTRLAQVPAAFWMPDASRFHLICFRSVAQYVEDVWALSAQGGGEVGFF
jgi:sarcosine oxidase subunit gamma